MDGAGLGRRLGAQLGGQHPPQPRVLRQPTGRLAGGQVRPHQQPGAGLVERVGVHGGRSDGDGGPGVGHLQRRRRGGEPGLPQQPDGVGTARFRPVRVRLVGEHRPDPEQAERAAGGGQRERRLPRGGPVPRHPDQPGRLVQVHPVAQRVAQPVAGPAARHRTRPERRAQPADQRGDVPGWLERRAVGPQRLDDAVHRHGARPVHGEQREQRPRLPAADLGVGEHPPVPDDRERTHQPHARPGAHPAMPSLVRHVPSDPQSDPAGG